MSAYTIGQLARLSGTGVETIRYYERGGLIDAPPRRASGYRQYPENTLARLRFIRHAKALGFTLKDIKELLELRVAPGSTCADIRKRAETKMADVRGKIEILRQMEQALAKLTTACRGRGPVGECPNVPLARERLLRAFAATGINAHWREWERNDAVAPAHVRAYGSPTILVDGKDVTGMEPSRDAAGSCRVYAQPAGTFDGAPSVETITGALRAITADAPKQPGWRGSFAALPAIGAAALPKLTCPACWPAYSGLLSSMGLSFVNYTAYLLPLTTLFLLVSLFALGWRAPSRCGYRPLLLGSAASLLILVGKFAFDSDAAMFAGMAVLVAASLWNAWPRSGDAAKNCPACVSVPTQS